MLIAIGWIMIGWGIFSAAAKMLKALKKIKNATNMTELNEAAEMFADAVIGFGVDTLIGLLTRGAGKLKRMGSGNQPNASGGRPKTRQEIEAENRARADEGVRNKGKPKYNERQLQIAQEEGLDPKWIKEDGEIDWPPNEGFDGLPTTGSLDPPAVFDRYGGYIDSDTGEFIDKGTFTSPPNIPFEQRSVTPSTLSRPYREYEVIKSIPGVKSGKIAPWFDQPGGGIQHKMPMSIEKLIEGKYIKLKGT